MFSMRCELCVQCGVWIVVLSGGRWMENVNWWVDLK